MSIEKPDHHDAELALRTYELRREPLLRDARRFLVAEFWPKTYADVQALTRLDHPNNAGYRQATTYWEMVYGIVRHGIVNPGYFLESNGEGLFIFAKLAPFVDQLRSDTTPRALVNAEWVATQLPEGRALYDVLSQRVRRLAEARRS